VRGCCSGGQRWRGSARQFQAGEVALAHKVLDHLRADAVVHGLQVGQRFALYQQQQGTFAQAQLARAGQEFQAGFFSLLQQHGCLRHGECGDCSKPP
jgi:hypothetical protein